MTITPPPDTVVGRLYQAINDRDFAAFDMLLTRNWVDHLETGPGDQAGFIISIKQVIEALPDFSICVEDMLLSSHHVTARLSLSGTHRRAFLGCSPTGRKLSFRAHDVHRVDGNRISESWQIEDWFSAFEQMKAPV